MIKLGVYIADDAEPLLKALGKDRGKVLKEANQVGARSAVNAAREYHRKYNAQGLWRGRRNNNSGKSKFGASVTAGWNTSDANESGATIYNSAPHYRHKVEGGTIRPKRAKALTIPLIQEAQGVRAKDFEVESGKRLFVPFNTNVLGYKTDQGFRPVYALVKSVTQAPWKGALPPIESLTSAFTEGVLLAIEDKIRQL